MTGCQVSENPKKRTGNRPDHHGPQSIKNTQATYFAGTDLRDVGEQLAQDPRLLGPRVPEAVPRNRSLRLGFLARVVIPTCRHIMNYWARSSSSGQVTV